MKEIEAKEAKKYIGDKRYLFLDVREPEELMTKIKGAITIPLGDLSKNLNKISKDKIVLINCRSGVRSLKACKILNDAGFKAYSLKGGIIAWENEKLPVE